MHLFGVGSNAQGQLGIPLQTRILSWITTHDGPIAQIKMGGYGRSALLTTDGRLFVTGTSFWSSYFGYREWTQLQTNTGVDKFVAMDISSHIMAIDESGRLWAAGNNGSGQLGLGDVNSRHELCLVNSDTDWESVWCGDHFTFASKRNGAILACGNNYYGQLGLGDATNRLLFTQVGFGFQKIACSFSATWIIKADGSLWATGNNIYGILAQGDFVTRYSFTRIGTLNTWSDIKASNEGYSALALRSDGTIWGAGNNNAGALGILTPGYINTLTQEHLGHNNWSELLACGTDHSIVRKTNGTIWGTGRVGDVLGLPSSTFYFTQLDMDCEKVALSSTSSSILIVKPNGELQGRGGNSFAQLGINPNTRFCLWTLIHEDDDWIFVATGEVSSYAIKQDGTLWACGNNQYGQLGLGFASADPMPWVQVGTDTDWVHVSGGQWHVAAMKRDGTVWVCGRNDRGQLGLGDWNSRYTFTNIGGTWAKIFVNDSSFHTFALKENGDLYCAGDGATGQCGWGEGDTGTYNTFIHVASNVATVNAGENETHIIKTDGTLWGTGWNLEGALGLGDYVQRTVFTQVGSDTDWKIGSEGGYLWQVIQKTDGSLWGAGDNRNGQLAQGHYFRSSVFIPITSATDWMTFEAGSSGSFLYAIKNDESLWGVGDNSNCQQGIGRMPPFNVPTIHKIVKFSGFSGTATFSKVSCSMYSAIGIGTISPMVVVPDKFPILMYKFRPIRVQ